MLLKLLHVYVENIHPFSDEGVVFLPGFTLKGGKIGHILFDQIGPFMKPQIVPFLTPLLYMSSTQFSEI